MPCTLSKRGWDELAPHLDGIRSIDRDLVVSPVTARKAKIEIYGLQVDVRQNELKNAHKAKLSPPRPQQLCKASSIIVKWTWRTTALPLIRWCWHLFTFTSFHSYLSSNHFRVCSHGSVSSFKAWKLKYVTKQHCKSTYILDKRLLNLTSQLCNATGPSDETQHCECSIPQLQRLQARGQKSYHCTHKLHPLSVGFLDWKLHCGVRWIHQTISWLVHFQNTSMAISILHRPTGQGVCVCFFLFFWIPKLITVHSSTQEPPMS